MQQVRRRVHAHGAVRMIRQATREPLLCTGSRGFLVVRISCPVTFLVHFKAVLTCQLPRHLEWKSKRIVQVEGVLARKSAAERRVFPKGGNESLKMPFAGE